MRKLATLATTAIAATALMASALTFAGTASAAPVGAADQPAARTMQLNGLKLSKNKPGSHFGQAGVTVTAKSVKRKGKITFVVAGQPIKATKKLKRGKAKFQLPSTLPAGTYKVKAKVKGVGKAAIRVIVYNSTLSLSAPAVTISQSANCSTSDPILTGQVLFKGSNPSEGYVDAYLNGDIKGGSSSPSFLTFDPVEGAGMFDFGLCDTLWSKVADLGIGVHNVQLLYTPDAAYEDYIYSDFISITVVA